MKKFVIARIDWFDHKLKQEIVEATDLYEAHKLALEAFYGFATVKALMEEGSIDTIEDMKHEAFNGDGMISAIEI